jgi:hypothetical protein
MCIHHQLVQCAARERIDAFMSGHRTVFQQHIVAVLFEQRRQKMIDEAGIDEGCIGRHPHDDICVQQLCGARKTRKHIVFGAAHDRHALLAAERNNGVVARIGGRGDGDLFDELRAAQAMDDVPEQRLTRDRLQHLAGQACRAHARLDDGDDAQMIAGFGGQAHAAGFHAARTWRSGRMPSIGSARHSRSSISEGCGPLKPVPSATKL